MARFFPTVSAKVSIPLNDKCRWKKMHERQNAPRGRGEEGESLGEDVVVADGDLFGGAEVVDEGLGFFAEDAGEAFV